MARPRARWLFAATALVAIGVIAWGRLADRLILWPTTEPLDPNGATRELLRWTRGDVEVFRASSSDHVPKLFVLRFYGNADRAERWVTSEARAWPDLAVEFWAVNYAGYGRSTGPARLTHIADAALVAYDALRARAGDRPIFVLGTSLGTTAAFHVAAEREVAGLVLTNPPALPELIVGEHGWWNLWLVAYPVSKQIPKALDSIANARRVRAPAVFVLADRDQVVPYKYQRLVADAFAGQKDILIQQGAGHNTPQSPSFAAEVHRATARLFSAVVTPDAGSSK